MILIGSRAIKHHFDDFPRDPKDTDYIVKEVPDVKEEQTEYLINTILENYQGDILDPDSLYTLKISHIFWDIKWEKHMFDIQFLRKKGCKLKMDLFYQLYEFWNVYHSKNRRSDLKMSAEDFFNNALKCEYDHDYLHTLINPSPTYQKVLIGEVEVSEEKFKLLSHQEKCDLVSEEVMVMAWERYSKLHYRVAYSKMLKKFIINHAPIWEAIFIIENFIELHKPKFNYFDKINQQLNGILFKTN